MTDAEKVQFDRLIAAGYDSAAAQLLVERGAWFETVPMLPEEVAEVRRHRAEHDAIGR